MHKPVFSSNLSQTQAGPAISLISNSLGMPDPFWPDPRYNTLSSRQSFTRWLGSEPPSLVAFLHVVSVTRLSPCTCHCTYSGFVSSSSSLDSNFLSSAYCFQADTLIHFSPQPTQVLISWFHFCLQSCPAPFNLLKINERLFKHFWSNPCVIKVIKKSTRPKRPSMDVLLVRKQHKSMGRKNSHWI